MHAMRNGLKWAGFLDLNCQYPEKTRPLFVHCGCELTIRSKLSSAQPHLASQLKREVTSGSILPSVLL